MRRRNQRTSDIKPLIAEARQAVFARDRQFWVGLTPVLGRCFFAFTPVKCTNRASATHEIIPRGRARREAQAKFFVLENQCEVCTECHEHRAQTKEGREMLQVAMTKVFGYQYDEHGFWSGYYEQNPKGVL